MWRRLLERLTWALGSTIAAQRDVEERAARMEHNYRVAKTIRRTRPSR